MINSMNFSQEIKTILKKYDLAVLKQLGQHFLVDQKVLVKIIEAAYLTKKDTVLEVGPGLGMITEALAEKAGQVVAVEIDKGLVKYLKRRFKNYKNVEIVHGDILKLKVEDLTFQVNNYSSSLSRTKLNLSSRLCSKNKFNYKVVANLPYYITSRVIRYFLETESKPELLVFLTQKEVAERICAQPNQMSLLSCSVQFYGQPEIVDFVSRESFWPKPEVDSAILKIQVYPKPKIKIEDKKQFFRIIKAGFSNKRKQLHNALAGGLHLTDEEVKNLLKKSGIDPTRRAQTLSLSEWAKLSHRVLNLKF